VVIHHESLEKLRLSRAFRRPIEKIENIGKEKNI